MNVIIGAVIGALIGTGIFFLTGSQLILEDNYYDFISITQVLKLAVTIIIMAIIGGLVGSMFVIAHQMEALIVELFGKFHCVKRAGLGVKMPSPFALIAGKVNLQVNLLQETVGVKSSDNAFLHVPVKLQYQAIEEKAFLAWYQLRDPKAQIIAYAVNTLRAEANNMTMDQIFSSKEEFKHKLTEGLSSKLEEYGYKIVDVLVDDPQPSDELKKSFDKVLAAKRDQEASELEKVAIMNRIVGKAEADAQSITLKATAYVTGRKILAIGNSAAIEEFCDGLNIEHNEALQYFAGLDMRDAIRDAASHGSVVIIPADMTGSRMAENISTVKALEKVKEEAKKR